MFKITVPLFCKTPLDGEILARLRRTGASRVAITVEREINHSFSSPETLDALKNSIEFFTEHGYDPLVWVGQTFGHDTARGGGKYTNIQCVDAVGNSNGSVFCPLDEAFLEDFKNWMRNLVRCGARLILLDDDFRLSYRGTGVGCCCDLHMKLLREELGEEISREELKEKVFSGGANRYRDAWLKVQKGSMEHFGRELRKAVDELDESVRLGFCCSPCGFDLDMDTISLAKIMAGDTKPFLRTLGAPYWATKPNRRHLGEILNMERMEIEWCRNAGIETIAEGDNFPRPRFMTPAAYVEVFESVLRADGVNDGILKYYWKFDDASDYETGYVEAHENARELNERIEELFCGKDETVGLVAYNCQNVTQNAYLDPNDPGRIFNSERSLYYPSLNFTAVTSMPTAFSGDGVKLVFGENARFITEEELMSGCVLDADAAIILTRRGIDVGLTKTEEISSFGASGIWGAVREYDADKVKSTSMLGNVRLLDLPRAKSAVTVSHYKQGDKFYEGVYRYENQKGARFLVYPFSADRARNERHWFNSYWRKEQLMDNLEFLGRKPFEVCVVSKAPMLYPLVKKNESSVAVGLWNIFEDKIHKLRIKVEGDYGKVSFVNCTGHREGKEIVLDSVLYPFEFAGFELKQ
ncbi:MAG: hypothetical protein E7646_04850 [Ruminococcaceae bacterium]|nr:hypothetical protein [Oscillospiraceae bacterium]